PRRSLERPGATRGTAVRGTRSGHRQADPLDGEEPRQGFHRARTRAPAHQLATVVAGCGRPRAGRRAAGHHPPMSAGEGVTRALPLRYSVRNVLVRWRATLATTLAVALVVAVYTRIQSLAAGLAKSGRDTGDPPDLMIVPKGS